jgi:hypothetical protein
VPTDEEFDKDREFIYERNYKLLIESLEKMPENRYFEAIGVLPIQEIQTAIMKALYFRNSFTVHKK